MPGAKELVAAASAEVGYLEKSKENYSLYGSDCLYYKTKFAGADNYTKYAFELRNVGLGHPNGHAWCQTFVAWLFWSVFGEQDANRLLCGMLTSASTMDVKDVMVRQGRQVPLNMAKAGDIVYRSRKGGGHVGIVKGRSSSGQIITIEGNSSSTDITSWNGGAVVEHIGATWEWCVRPDYNEPETWAWIQSGGKWYYQNNRGENWHGWKLIKESAGEFSHWYYFDAVGAMLTGVHWIDDKLCLFMPYGDLQGAMCVTDGDPKGYQHVWNIK